MAREFFARLLIGAAALALAGCDGGVSTQTSFIPPPTTTPAPTPAPAPAGASAVTIFPQPVVGQFASAGVWTNLYSATSSETGRFNSIDKNASEPIIRYNAGGFYEVALPDEDFGALIHDPKILNPAPDDPFLLLFRACCGTRAFTLDNSKAGYSYSAMATWRRNDLDFGYTIDSGVVAFGSFTAGGSIPLSGNASYEGVVAGLTDAKTFDALSNSWLLLPAGGTVELNFDFGKGALAGQLDLSVAGGMNPIPVGTYKFAQTVFSPGSTGYSGTFATTLTGTNFFDGLFTGPNAQETIGRWAVPFQLDGGTHQALGAWMAKAAH